MERTATVAVIMFTMLWCADGCNDEDHAALQVMTIAHTVLQQCCRVYVLLKYDGTMS